MARFTADTADKYGSSGNGGSYLKLTDDGDVATVRFLYNSADDIEGYAVHEVEINGKKRYVNCLREYNQPLDDCPFCRDHKKVLAKLFIPIYNEDEQKVQVFERGKQFFSKLSKVCSRYDKKPIVSQLFEIERNGAKGDTSTQYEIFRTEDEADDKTLADFEMPQIVGDVYILDKSAEDMEYYLESGEFPPEDEDDVPRRRTSRNDDEQPTRRSSRRTPANRDRF